MEISHNIRIDLAQNGVAPHLTFMQGDSARKIAVKLYENNAAWNVPKAASAYIAFLSPNGGKLSVVSLADGSPVVSHSGNEAIISVPPELTILTGNIPVVVVFVDSDGKQIATFPISVSILDNPSTDSDPASPVQPDLFVQIMAAISVERERIDSIENSVLYTKQVLTDEQKAQARANIGAAKEGSGGGGGSSVEIDTTLSIPGAAADAAAVGAKLGDIETALDDIIAIQNALIGGDS